jgi:hypothetical protein
LFLDQVGAYETWVLVAVFSSIALLVGGVVSFSNIGQPQSQQGLMDTLCTIGSSLPQKDRRGH